MWRASKSVGCPRASAAWPSAQPPADLTIADGEFVVIVGPSGCGKSTLLRLIAGLEEPSTGRLVIGGRDVTDAAPADRGLAMVFQSYALYPHLTVAENIAFPLKVARRPKAEIAARVAAVAEPLGLGHCSTGGRAPCRAGSGSGCRSPGRWCRRAQGAAARQAAVEPRRRAAGADAARVRAAPRAARRDDDLPSPTTSWRR
ncbi:ABC transporter ATP-binding protein [Sphingomonas sp. MMS24-JH45]